MRRGLRAKQIQRKKTNKNTISHKTPAPVFSVVDATRPRKQHTPSTTPSQARIEVLGSNCKSFGYERDTTSETCRPASTGKPINASAWPNSIQSLHTSIWQFLAVVVGTNKLSCSAKFCKRGLKSSKSRSKGDPAVKAELEWKFS
jgi:hypothetical protein